MRSAKNGLCTGNRWRITVSHASFQSPCAPRTGLCSALAQRQCSVPFCGLPRLTEGTGERLRKSLVEDSR